VNSSTKRKLVAVVAGLAVTAGGGLAFAASKDSAADQRKAFLDNAANRLRVTPDQLSSALEGAFGDQLDAAVRAGRLTQAQADEMKRRIKEHGGVPFFGGPGGPGGFRGRGPGGRFGHHGPFGQLDAAAKYLGLSADKLRAQLKAGKSLADVAKAQGKEVAGLEQAITDAAKADLDKAVAAKRLTQAQADRIAKELASHVGDLVQGKRPAGGPGPGPGGPGFGRGDGDRDGDHHGPWGPPGMPPAGSGNGSSNGAGSTAPDSAPA